MLVDRQQWIRNKALKIREHLNNSSDYAIWDMPQHLIEGLNLKTIELIEEEIYLQDIEFGFGLEVRRLYEEAQRLKRN